MDKATLHKWLLVVAGILAVGLAVVGIFVPVLPTTPFLLLAAACFMRSSGRLYNWLIHHKWFGEYIRHYREYRAITLQEKALTLVALWVGIGVTAVFAVTLWWVRALLAAVAVGVTLHITHIRTLTPEMLQSSQTCFEGGDA
ncbi:MAG: YbaN family protein [Anaerolineae bacterium]|nr:YbaN family protein [Anaerolineae bacterium]